MAETDSTSEYKLSSYNSAGNQILRLHELWNAAHKDVRRGNYLDWNIVLDRLWLEVSGDLKPDAIEHKKMNMLNAQIVKLFPLVTGNMTGFNKKSQDYYNKLSQQYLLIREKEMLVKFTEGKLGLGKSYVDEFEDDWD